MTTNKCLQGSKLLLLIYQTFFHLLDRPTENDEFVQKLPRYHFSINVSLLRDAFKPYFNISTSPSVNL